MFDDICFKKWTNILVSYFSLKDLVNQNTSLKEQLDKAISEKKLIEKTSSTELEPKLEVILSNLFFIILGIYTDNVFFSLEFSEI